MLRFAALFALLGLFGATFLIAQSGAQDVAQALRQAGWGIAVTSLYHLVSLIGSSACWQQLIPGKSRPGLPYLSYVMWLRASVNNLMPVARIGGELVAVRIMIKHGVRKTVAVASTVVQLTLSVLAVFLFNIVGVGLFILKISDRHMEWKLAGAMLLCVPPVALLVTVQKFGFFGLLEKTFRLMFRDKWKNFFGSAALLDRAVHRIYMRKAKILIAFLWVLAAWMSGILETALALYFLGHPLDLPSCFMLEALIQTAVNIAFAVPGALGVQEAGFLYFGQMLGLPPDTALALAMMRRCRDVLIFVPGLIAWQLHEGKWLVGKIGVRGQGSGVRE